MIISPCCIMYFCFHRAPCGGATCAVRRAARGDAAMCMYAVHACMSLRGTFVPCAQTARHVHAGAAPRKRPHHRAAKRRNGCCVLCGALHVIWANTTMPAANLLKYVRDTRIIVQLQYTEYFFGLQACLKKTSFPWYTVNVAVAKDYNARPSKNVFLTDWCECAGGVRPWQKQLRWRALSAENADKLWLHR